MKRHPLVRPEHRALSYGALQHPDIIHPGTVIVIKPLALGPTSTMGPPVAITSREQSVELFGVGRYEHLFDDPDLRRPIVVYPHERPRPAAKKDQ